MPSQPSSIAHFLLTVANLKSVVRTGWSLVGVHNPESVADHSFMTAILGLTLIDEEDCNKDKLIRLCIVHDLLESLTGDIVWQRGGEQNFLVKSEKERLEKDALDVLFNESTYAMQNIKELVEEYISQTSIEAKLVKELDKLEMALQASIYREQMNTSDFESFIKTASQHIETEKIKKVFSQLIDPN